MGALRLRALTTQVASSEGMANVEVLVDGVCANAPAMKITENNTNSCRATCSNALIFIFMVCNSNTILRVESRGYLPVTREL
jgi:hypothetical protein